MVYFSIIFINICFFIIPLLKNKFHFFMPSFVLFITNIVPYSLGFLYYDNQSLIRRDFDCDVLFSLMLILTGLTYYISYNVYYKRKLCLLDNVTFVIKSFPKMYYAFLLLVFCCSLYYLLNATGLNPVDNSLMFRVRSSHDYGVIYALYINIPMIILIFSTYWLWVRKEKIFLLFIIISLLSMMFSGSRGMLIMGLLGIAMIYKMIYHIDVSKKLKIIALVIGGVFSIIYPVYRMTGTIDVDLIVTIIENISWENKDILEPLLRSDAMKNLYILIDAIDNNIIDYKYGESLLDTLTMLIPRALYADKPLFFNNEVHKVFSDEFAFGTLDFNSDYFMGEAFANFFVFGAVLYGWIWGWLMCQYDKIYKLAYCNEEYILSVALFYLPTLFSLNIPEMGFNGMAFQQFVIMFVLCIIQKLIIKRSCENGQQKNNVNIFS